MAADEVLLYLIVWLGAGLSYVHESLQRVWCSLLRRSLGKVIEMLRRPYDSGENIALVLHAPPLRRSQYKTL